MQAAAGSVTDWDLFGRLVERHRVTRLVYDGLARAGVSLPLQVKERLRQRTIDCAFGSFKMVRESVRLQRAFQDAGLPALIVKGVAVGILAYVDPTMKESWDIDLLTSAEALPEAHALLLQLGYELREPDGLGFDQFMRFARTSIEACYIHSESGMTVELHWRVAVNRRILPDVNVHSSSQVVRIAGRELRTFSNDILFAYLGVHGVHHSWSRLKWLADFGAFVAARSPEEIEELYERAIAVGAGRAPAASLLLCHRLLGTRLPPQLLPRLRADVCTRIIEANALHQVRRRTAIDTTRAPPARLLVSRFVLIPGAAYLIEQMRATWDSPVERARYGALFHVLRLPLWLGRAVRRLTRPYATA